MRAFSVVWLLLAGASTFALKKPMPALPFLGAMVVLFEPRALVASLAQFGARA